MFDSVFSRAIMAILALAIILVHMRCCTCTRFNEVNYSYKYAIEKAEYGIVTNQWENRVGDQAKGGYSLLDADGRVRVVDYTVDGQRGYKAYVTFRKPFTGLWVGHLQFPKEYRTPIRLATPVSLITADLFKAPKTYPNFYK